MPYIGKQPANVPVTADDIPNDSITAAKIVDAAITIDDIGPNAVGNSEMADDAIGLNELSATGTTNSSTFLRGDNTWAVPPDNNTTYSVQDGQLSQNNFTDADHSKLNAIEASADVTDATNVSAAGALMKSGGTMTGTIAGFTSTGIDDNADATAITINSSEQVGIGTTSPTNNLHIKSAGNTDQNFIQVEDSDGNKALRLLSTSSTGDNELIVYNTSGSGQVKLNSNGHSYFNGGNVGIGTASPSKKLEIAVSGTDGVLMSGANGYVGSTNDLVIDMDSNNDYSGNVIKFTQHNGASELMRIADSGNVGIGETSPATSIHITSDTPKIRLEHTNDNGYAEIYTSAQSAIVLDADPGNTDNGTPIVFKTDGTERMRVLDSGGLTFNGDTAAANALDDYEEGTWTPTITCETSGSYTLQGGADLAAYTKIGRVVTVQGGLSVSGESSPNGNLRITLPFSAFFGTDDTDYCMGNLALGNHGSTLDVAGLNAFIYGGAYFYIWGVNADGTTRYIKHTDVDTNFQVYFNFSYIAA